MVALVQSWLIDSVPREVGSMPRSSLHALVVRSPNADCRCRSAAVELAQEGRRPLRGSTRLPRIDLDVVAVGVDIGDGLIASRGHQQVANVRRRRLKPRVGGIAHGHHVATDLLFDAAAKRVVEGVCLPNRFAQHAGCIRRVVGALSCDRIDHDVRVAQGDGVPPVR